MEFIKKNINWIALGACVLVALSVFLPFATVSATVFGITASESITFIEGDGIILLVLVIIAAALLFVKNRKAKIASIVLLAAGIVMSIYDAINASSAVADVGYGIVKTSFGIGFYLDILGSVLAIAAIVYSEFFLSKKSVEQNVFAAPTEPVAPVQPVVQSMPVEPVVPVQPVVQPMPTEPVAPVQPVVQPMPVEPVVPVQPVVQPMPTEPVVPVQSVVQPMPAEPVVPVQPVVQPMPTEPVVPVQPVAAEPVAPVQEQAVPVVVCPVCGTTSNYGTEVCGLCGNKLN